MKNSALRRCGRSALAVALVAGAFAGSARADDATADHSMLLETLQKFIDGLYGTFDVSVDDSTKGMAGMVAYHITQLPNGTYGLNYSSPKGPPFIYGPGEPPGNIPFGNVNWEPAISTNASGIGWRGSHAIPGWTDTKLVMQIEGMVGMTASPGVVTSYTAQTNGVSGTIGLGTSFIGFGGSWGALKLGHGVTPYKKSSDRLDPFAGMIGDMPTIMGNTGGDNRVEFNSVMDHAIWYESPRWEGVSFDYLFSPGQNRTPDSTANLAGGSDNCNGNDVPGSGNLPLNCDDGGFDNAWSVDLKYESKHLYLFGAFEFHENVNRNSDGVGSNSPIYANMWAANSPFLNYALYNQIASYFGATGPCGTGANIGSGGGNGPGGNNYYCVNASPEFLWDIGNEKAMKGGFQYIFDMGLTVSAMFERMEREMPAVLEWANERQRNGTWLALTQQLGPSDNINLGWAHAGRTPGDPAGQHNFDPASTNDTADMYTVAFKHRLDKQLYLYADLAETHNNGNAHFDLGGGGHGIKTDCHDGTTTPVQDYTSAGNTTWGGCHPKGISIGLNYKF